jgi:2-polyprenyl-3-methyl-5-hydroxy-6-metoxy-1,4-benzoquinol methylase
LAQAAEPVVVRGKPLDIRRHKKDWLSSDFLFRYRQQNLEFCRDVLNHPRRVNVQVCYICGSPDRALCGTVYGIPYFQCSECTLTYANYCLNNEDLAEHYRTQYFTDSVYLDKEQVRLRNFLLMEPKLRFIGDFVRTGRRRWLDVGTGNGAVVFCAQEMGFEAYGLEPSPEGRLFAHEVFNVDIMEHPIGEELHKSGTGFYDVVSFLMVLEHVTDPADQVRHGTQLISQDGLIVIEVPLATSIAALSDIQFPDHALRQLCGSHMMNYTDRSLEYLAEKNDLDIVGKWYMGQDIFTLVLHFAQQVPGFLGSRLCDFFLDHNDELQSIVDAHGLSDEVVLVLRKR